MPPKPKTSELVFPTGGLSRRFSYQDQPPYTSFDMANVWPNDPLEGRERGGSRPGVSKVLTGIPGSGGPVQCLTSVAVVGTNAVLSNVLVMIENGIVHYSDSGTDFSVVTSGSELVSNGGFETLSSGTPDDGTTDNFANWTESGSGKVEQVSATTTAPHGGTYCLKLDGTGTASQCWILQNFTVAASTRYRLSFWTKSSDGVHQVTRYLYDVTNAGDITDEAGESGLTETGVLDTSWRKVNIDLTTPAGCVSLRLVLYAEPPSGASTHAPIYVDDVSLYKLHNALNTSPATLQATAQGGKVYIADYRPTRIYYTDGVLANTNELTSASITDWTTLGIDTDLDVVVLTNTDSTSEDDVYAITSVSASKLVVDGTLTAKASGVVFEIGRAPKVYDPADDSVADLALAVKADTTNGYGIVPLNCPLICTYRDRIVLALSNNWYMCRSGAPHDWDLAYTPEDPLRAMASTITDAAGKVQEPILALIPVLRDYLVFGCERSIFLMQGDPGAGGQIITVSDEVGIIGPQAWAKAPDGTLVFLSRLGLYVMAAGSSQEPQPWSEEILPQSLLDVDVTANTVAMSYDGRNKGVHVFITPTDGSTGEHYFLSWRTKAVCPVTLQDDQQPTCLETYAADQGEAAYVLQGCYDGYLRRYDSTATQDDGSNDIDSYVIIGPLRLAGPGEEGGISHIGCTLDEDSADVDWELYVGDSGEAVCDSATPAYTGTWSAGFNYPTAPRVRGGAAKLKMSASDAWAMEGVPITVEPLGRKF